MKEEKEKRKEKEEIKKKQEKENKDTQEEVVEKNKWVRVISLIFLLLIIFSFVYYSIYSIYNMKDYSNAYTVERKESDIIIKGKEKDIHDIQELYLENRKLNYDILDEELVASIQDRKKEESKEEQEEIKYIKIIAKDNEEKIKEIEKTKAKEKETKIKKDNIFLRIMKKIDGLLGKKEDIVTIVIRLK